MSGRSVAGGEGLTVAHFQRCPTPRYFSLERVFEDIRAGLPEDVVVAKLECPWPSIGLRPRLRNVLWARRNAAPINHITGDVHYVALGLPKDRTILTIHDCVSLVRSSGARRWLLKLLWYDLPVKRAAVVTVISEFTKRELLALTSCDPDRIRVVHDPVSPVFQPKPKAFNPTKPNLLLVGTAWNKNLERIVEALETIPCSVTIVGELSESQHGVLLRSRVSFEQHDSLTERELVRLYEQCDLLIFASLYEGFGLPIVEAQAVGRPVVTSDRCSMPEVAGDAACLVDPENVQSIRMGVRKVMEDPGYREELVQRGLENVKRFHPARLAAQYAEIYRQVSPRWALVPGEPHEHIA